jgi:thiamine biosynthesis protein ThiS
MPRKIVVKVKIFGQQRSRKIELPRNAKVIDLLKSLGQNPQAVVVRRNGKIVVEEERLTNEDSIEIVPIVTGG